MFNQNPRPLRVIACFWSLLIVITLLSGASAQVSSPSPETVIPLEGLDPVMLSQGKEVQGDMKYNVKRGQFQYLFASAENKATFEKDPSRYAIQLNGHCARMGAPTTGNPDLYTVHNGRIYIFGSEECQTLFKAAPEKYLETPPAPKSPPSAANIKRGQELIAKAVGVLGGGPKLDQLQSFQKTELRGNQVKTILVLGFPDAVRQEVVRPNFTLTSIVTPAESFVVFNNAARPMSEANRAAISKDLYHEPIVLLRARTRPDFKAWLAGDNTVEIELPDFTTTLGIDPDTGRVINQTYRGRGPGGIVGQIVINYSDFRTVEGLSLPFKTTATFDGQPFPPLSATVEAVTINGRIDPSTFKKPQATKTTALAQSSDWPQWGGPHRNFVSDTKGLATTWPATGPQRLWQRELGDGYSGIAVERGMLFTMYRKAENEVVIALDAQSGKTLWEYSYAAPFSPEYDMTNGPGPHATPLVSNDFVFTSGATGKLHCLDKKSGKVLWSHDLLGEFHGTLRVNGYS
jgi:YHS domain-containing protein